MEIAKGPPGIKSENARPNAWIYVDIQGIDVGTYVRGAQQAVAEQVEVPAGYNIGWSGQYEYMLRAERRLLVPSSWIESLDEVTKPVIAAIHGVCFGGGMELALACDIRMASADARFALTETRLGLIPGGGGTQRLPRLIGLGPALDLLLSADRIDAKRAHQLGIVTRVSPDRDALMTEALALAEAIAERPPAAIAPWPRSW